jgi:hypothetical protein
MSETFRPRNKFEILSQNTQESFEQAFLTLANTIEKSISKHPSKELFVIMLDTSSRPLSFGVKDIVKHYSPESKIIFIPTVGGLSYTWSLIYEQECLLKDNDITELEFQKIIREIADQEIQVLQNLLLFGKDYLLKHRQIFEPQQLPLVDSMIKSPIIPAQTTEIEKTSFGLHQDTFENFYHYLDTSTEPLEDYKHYLTKLKSQIATYSHDPMSIYEEYKRSFDPFIKRLKASGLNSNSNVLIVDEDTFMGSSLMLTSNYVIKSTQEEPTTPPITCFTFTNYSTKDQFSTHGITIPIVTGIENDSKYNINWFWRNSERKEEYTGVKKPTSISQLNQSNTAVSKAVLPGSKQGLILRKEIQQIARNVIEVL